MNKKLYKFGYVLCVFFLVACGKKDGITKHYKEFIECISQKSDTPAAKQKSAKMIEKMNELEEKIRKNCSEDEIQKITQKTKCFADTCQTASAPVNFERIMKDCKDDELYPQLSDKCLPNIGFGG